MIDNPILVINAGSSSLKYKLFDTHDEALVIRRHGQQPLPAGGDERYAEALQGFLQTMATDGLGAIGHRVVHGGTRFTGPVLVDDGQLAAMERLVPLAPLHQPHNLEPIRIARRLFPGVPQVACFDTSFHRTHPPLAERLPIPRDLHEAGVRHYGFHGLSYDYIARQLPAGLADGRVVVLHLGSGASACALLAGRSIDSTMGFTALDGLVMSTRPGRLDPGVVLYLLQQGATAAEIEDLLYHRCGLLGLSGISGDVRVLTESGDPDAAFALDSMAYRAAGSIASLASALGGLDGVVFTAGVGENAAGVRAAICRRCAWLGLDLDPTANTAGSQCITTPGSPVTALVIPTDEEWMIAHHTRALLTA